MAVLIFKYHLYYLVTAPESKSTSTGNFITEYCYNYSLLLLVMFVNLLLGLIYKYIGFSTLCCFGYYTTGALGTYTLSIRGDYCNYYLILSEKVCQALFYGISPYIIDQPYKEAKVRIF